MPGHSFDDVLRFAGLEQVRHHCVSQVMESETGQAGSGSKRPPGGVPLFRRLGRIELVVLTRTPTVVVWVRVSESVGAPQHARNRLFGSLLQRNRPLARLVLAAGDVQHAFAGCALDVPDLLEIDIAPAYMLYLYAPHGGVS